MSIEKEWQEQDLKLCATAADMVAQMGVRMPLDLLNEYLDQPFGRVPVYASLTAFALWQRGYPVEYRDPDGDWNATEQPLWGSRMVYRLLPKAEALVLPSIDWSHVAPGFKWLAQCENGFAYFSEKEPYIASADHVGWSFPGTCVGASPFASFKPGNGNWRKLIVQRPEGA